MNIHNFKQMILWTSISSISGSIIYFEIKSLFQRNRRKVHFQEEYPLDNYINKGLILGGIFGFTRYYFGKSIFSLFLNK